MKKVLLPTVVIAALVGAALVFAVASSTTSAGRFDAVLAGAAKGQLHAATVTETTPSGATTVKTLPFISDATLAAAQDALGVTAGDERAEGADATGDIALDGSSGAGGSTTGSGPAHTLGCGARTSSGNARVNQDCTFRRQAEEDITYNPLDSKNLLGGQNDSRVGFNQCGIDFSTNNGKNWGDLLPPFRQKLNEPDAQEPTASDPNRHTIDGGPGTEHTYDAGSDPAMAMDALGRGYFSCVTFDVASNASGLYVTQSPPGAEGSFFFNWTARQWTVAEDNDGLIFHDKNFVTADRYASSPNAGNVYVTWTVFK